MICVWLRERANITVYKWKGLLPTNKWRKLYLKQAGTPSTNTLKEEKKNEIYCNMEHKNIYTYFKQLASNQMYLCCGRTAHTPVSIHKLYVRMWHYCVNERSAWPSQHPANKCFLGGTLSWLFQIFEKTWFPSHMDMHGYAVRMAYKHCSLIRGETIWGKLMPDLFILFAHG